MGDWHEVTIVIHRECEEAVGEILANLGAQGHSVEDSRLALDTEVRWTGDYWPEVEDNDTIQIRAYFSEELSASQRSVLCRQLADLETFGLETGAWEMSQRIVAEEDWAHAWKSHYHTETFQRIVIKPVWEDYEPEEDQIVIAMDPGMAFGTGGHPTTSMCLEALQTVPLAGATFWDIGTGSGILSCAASGLGASKLYACDIDRTAVESARINAERNGASVDVVCGTIEALPGTADVIVANIIADVITAIAETAAHRLNPGGLFLASGIIENRIGDVQASLTAAGFAIVTEWRRGEWYCVLASRS